MAGPLARYAVVCDGGSIGNPGRGYGSFRLRRRGEPWSEPVQLEFGDGITNNEAEYRSLIGALHALLETCGDPARVAVEVLTDSKLVVMQLQGRWKVRAGNLAPLHRAARRVAGRFGEVRYVWHPREKSVELLGH